jgi:hypothetical protein
MPLMQHLLGFPAFLSLLKMLGDSKLPFFLSSIYSIFKGDLSESPPTPLLRAQTRPGHRLGYAMGIECSFVTPSNFSLYASASGDPSFVASTLPA